MSAMVERAPSAEQDVPDLGYRRAAAKVAERVLHPDLAELRAPGHFDERSLDAIPPLADRVATFGGHVDGSRRFGVLATVEGVAIAASVAAWSRPSNLLDHGPHTRGIVRARVAPSVARLRITRRSLLGLRAWRSRLGLLKECAVTDPAVQAAFVVTGDEETSTLTLSDGVRPALLAMRAILTHVAVGGGVVEVAWSTSTFDQHSVLPSAVLVAVVQIARAAP